MEFSDHISVAERIHLGKPSRNGRLGGMGSADGVSYNGEFGPPPNFENPYEP